MFKKLLGIVLALTLALGACSAVFAEKSYDWAEGEREAAKGEVESLLGTLDMIKDFLVDLDETAGIIVNIAQDNGKFAEEDIEIAEAKVKNVLEKMADGIDEAITFMAGILDSLFSDPDYSKQDYENDLNTAAKSLTTVMGPETIEDTYDVLKTIHNKLAGLHLRHLQGVIDTVLSWVDDMMKMLDLAISFNSDMEKALAMQFA